MTAGGVIQSESKRLRTRGADGVSPILRAGKDEMRRPISTVRQKRAGSCDFCAVQPSADGMVATCRGEGHLVYQGH